MDERTRSKKIVAVVGEKVSRCCVPCGAEAGFLEIDFQYGAARAGASIVVARKAK